MDTKQENKQFPKLLDMNCIICSEIDDRICLECPYQPPYLREFLNNEDI